MKASLIKHLIWIAVLFPLVLIFHESIWAQAIAVAYMGMLLVIQRQILSKKD